MKINWPNTISNNKLQKIIGTIKLGEEIKINKCQYIGHILRKDRNNNIRRALIWIPEGVTSRGRPRETWRRTVEHERKEMGGGIVELQKRWQKKDQSGEVCASPYVPQGTKRIGR